LEDLGEVLDHDLSEEEKAKILRRLDLVVDQSNSHDLENLAASIKTFITNDHPNLVTEVPHFWKKVLIKFKAEEAKWVTRTRLKITILACLSFLGVRMVFYPVLIISLLRNPGELSTLLISLIDEHLVKNASGLTWYQARIGIEGSIGIVLLVSVILLLIRKDKTGILLSYVALIFSLTVVNLVVFYFNQFSALYMAILQFIVLLLIMRFRNRFLKI
jgi:hypothetical protein